MITLRRSAERHHVRRGRGDVWFTFHPENGGDPSAGGFETLFVLNEALLPPGASVLSVPFQEAEVITYVVEGALACKGSPGGSGVTYAGEFQRRSVMFGTRHREANALRSAWTRVFQISLPSSPGGLPPRRETKRFSIAQRRGVLCIVASRDGRKGSLRIQSSAQVYSAVLDSGRHLAHELAPGRRAWLHVVSGKVRVGGVVLVTGDGVGVAAECAVSLIAQDASEILLLGLAEVQSWSSSTQLTP